MLRSKDSPDGCPKLMFQSVALSVLSCFTQDEEIMTHPSVNFSIHLFFNHLFKNNFNMILKTSFINSVKNLKCMLEILLTAITGPVWIYIDVYYYFNITFSLDTIFSVLFHCKIIRCIKRKEIESEINHQNCMNTKQKYISYKNIRFQYFLL